MLRTLARTTALSSTQINNVRPGALAMAKCMRAHGVTNFPDPVVSAGPGGHGIRIQVGGQGAGIVPRSPASQAAIRDCQPLLNGARAALGGGAGATPYAAGNSGS